MNPTLRTFIAFTAMAGLIALLGVIESWPLALTVVNLCLISAIMALGVNLQWGYAGLFNVGVMGFAALGGVAAVLVASNPVKEAWSAGGVSILISLVLLIVTIVAATFAYRRVPKPWRKLAMIIVLVAGYFCIRFFYTPAVEAIEAVDPSKSGFLGGLGLPILFSWIIGGLFAAGVAWIIGKIALGLRADYLAIATLGISEIIIAILKNEDWLTRGVKNVSGLPRPVPYEIDLQQSPWFIEQVESYYSASLAALSDAERVAALQSLVIDASSIVVKLCYTGLFSVVLLIILGLSMLALSSPWGRMVRAIRDNEVAAEAMGKDVTGRHLQIFILGSAIIGIAGAMLVTLDGQFTPGNYNPLRFTFLIWVMVIVGGSGNNLGAVLGGFLIWYLWVVSEPLGYWLINHATSWMGDDSNIRAHFMDNAQYMRVFVMGVVMLLVMRFSPGGILPERKTA